MARALLVIDMSKDFVCLDGALTCGQAGVEIVPYCASLTAEFLAAGDLVIDARDLHDPDDEEIRSGLFPPHNMRGTPGRHLVDELYALLSPRPDLWLEIPKKQYNAGHRTELYKILRSRNIDELHLVGVCTDICVRYTLNGLYEFKTGEWPSLRLVVHERGVASFNLQGHRDSLQHFPIAFGATVVPASPAG